MASELLAGLSIFKSLYDSAKAVKDMNDAAARYPAVIELEEKILSAHTAQLALSQRIRALERQVADFETWDAEKKKYKLDQVTPGSFAYALEPNTQGPEPAHYICAACYEHRKKSILQRKPESSATIGLHKPPMYLCPECKMEIIAPGNELPWSVPH